MVNTLIPGTNICSSKELAIFFFGGGVRCHRPMECVMRGEEDEEEEEEKKEMKEGEEEEEGKGRKKEGRKRQRGGKKQARKEGE